MNKSVSYRFPKSLRLLTQRQFQRFRHDSMRCTGKFLVLDIRKRSHSQLKMGISVSRKYGKAHKRNRFKRLVREAFRLSQHSIPKGTEFVVKPRTAAEFATRAEIMQELVQLMGQDS